MQAHARHATWLIWEERPNGGPFIVREFIRHDSTLQFGGLNQVNPDTFNIEVDFRDYPVTGHIADTAKPTKTTQDRNCYTATARSLSPYLIFLPLPRIR
jgi:hypothetical protein